MGVQSTAATGASRNRIGACTRGPASWADLAVRFDRGRNLLIPALVALHNGRVPADGSPGRTDDGRVVCDSKLEPTSREV